MPILDRLFLDVANRKRLGVDLTDAVQNVTRVGGVEEVPTLTITIQDPDQLLMASSELVRPAKRKIGTPDAFTLRPIDLLLDGVWYRLTKASPDGPETALTLEHRGVAYMREHKTAISASRASTTRALFIRRQVDEIGRKRGAGHKVGFWAPGLRLKQPIAKATDEDTGGVSKRSDQDREIDKTTKATDTGDTSITVKGAAATSEQKRNIAICLDVASQLDAPEKAILAMLCAGIGESGFTAQMNQAGSPYGGVFQGNVRGGVWDIDDTEGMCRCFFKGGKGFQAGGAISLAQRIPGITPGEIATRVEAGGAAASFYGDHLDEAKKLMGGLSGVDIASDDPDQTYTTSYKFRRDKGESAWDCTGRLAEEVDKLRFITIPRQGSDVFIYAAGQDLHKLPVQATFSPSHPAVASPLDYELDYRKTARSLSITLLADTLSAPMMWGFPIQLNDAGAATGRWIVWSVQEDDSSPTIDVELRAPTPAKPEPRSQTASRPQSDVADSADDQGDGGGDNAEPIDGSDLHYPLADHGTSLGGVAAHGSRAWGNWQSDNAVDIGVPQGTRVYAVDDGMITKLGGQWDGTGRSNPNGFNVTLTTRDNAWFYTHMKYRTDLHVGQKVKAGDFFGSSGAANGVNHLHIASEHGDPEQLLKV